MNTKLTISIILMIIGIIAIIISQTVSFAYETRGEWGFPCWETNYDLKYGILFGGIGFLLIGGIILAISLGRTKFSKKENIADIDGKNKILFCPNCGAKLEGDNEFCPECGTPL